MKPSSLSCRSLQKSLRYGSLALLLSAAPMGQANAAISIVDIYSDNNIITSQDNSVPTSLIVDESYGELTWVPYPSHDGYAVVNSNFQYFDKLLTYTDAISGTSSTLQFNVTNNTLSSWSDYHIELWDSTFTTRLSSSLVTGYINDQFTSSDNTGGVVSFWAPGSHNPLETGAYAIETDLYAINDAANGSIGIRQVATVPEPASMALVGIGLAGLLGYRRANREHSVA